VYKIEVVSVKDAAFVVSGVERWRMSIVICFRCLNGYDIEKVQLRRTKRLAVKEPACPKCKCKLYFSRSDDKPLAVIFQKESFTAIEDD